MNCNRPRTMAAFQDIYPLYLLMSNHKEMLWSYVVLCGGNLSLKEGRTPVCHFSKIPVFKFEGRMQRSNFLMLQGL